MGYFLGKTWLWFLLAIVIAVIITWLIFWWRSRGAAADEGSTAELTRLRAERDDLQKKLTAVQAAHDGCQQQLTVAQNGSPALTDARAQVVALQMELAVLQAEKVPAATVPAAAAAVPVAAAEPEPAVATSTLVAAPTAEAPTAEAPAAEAPAVEAPAVVTPSAAEAAPDLQAGAAVMGRPVTLDRLEMVEGIGPKIAGLLHEAGIGTWRELSATPVERLAGILRAAGSRYQFHNPSTWPWQAELLANGQWAEFKQRADQLKGGRETV